MSRVAATGFGLCVFLATGTAWAQHGHHCDPATAVADPVLSVGDFNGDGKVSAHDLALLGAQLDTGEYLAFFDRNADYVLDGHDAAATAQEMGGLSTVLDRQLVDLFWSTEMYRDADNALAAGFRPFTQSLMGHGAHFARMPFWVTPTGLDPTYVNNLDSVLHVDDPEGLNYDENGELVAVFYYHGIDIRRWVLDPSAQATLVQQSIALTAENMLTGGAHTSTSRIFRASSSPTIQKSEAAP